MTGFLHDPPDVGVRPAKHKLWAAGLLLALAALSILAYARSISLPLIADDYLQVQLGRDYGPVSQWTGLAADPLYRSRSTSILLTYWTERVFGVSALAFALTSLGLHILNTWLLFAMGSWKRVGWRASFIAAAFFAVYEGHQEAVIWYAALPELLVFFFAMISLLAWIAWLAHRGSRSPLLYAGALAGSALAMLSKESAVVLVPLLALAAWVETRDWKRIGAVAPFAALAVLNAVAIFLGSNGNQHFHDGTFSLQAPFWIVWTNSFGRLFWFVGLAAAAALAFWRQIGRRWHVIGPALVWVAITLLPYCFLTYMPRIPSRHTYLASAGLSFVVAAGFLAFQERCWLRRMWAPSLLATVVIAANCGYLWTRKHAQFVERAEPTEKLIEYVKSSPGPVRIHCFPYGMENALLAVEIGTGKPASILVIDPARTAENVFCLGDQHHRPITRTELVATRPEAVRPEAVSAAPSSR